MIQSLFYAAIKLDPIEQEQRSADQMFIHHLYFTKTGRDKKPIKEIKKELN